MTLHDFTMHLLSMKEAGTRTGDLPCLDPALTSTSFATACIYFGGSGQAVVAEPTMKLWTLFGLNYFLLESCQPH